MATLTSCHSSMNHGIRRMILAEHTKWPHQGQPHSAVELCPDESDLLRRATIEQHQVVSVDDLPGIVRTELPGQHPGRAAEQVRQLGGVEIDQPPSDHDTVRG